MNTERKHRLIDIARLIDRDKSTIIRWEEMGLIPSAKRDSRGWRYYSSDEVENIVKKVHETNYFRNAVHDAVNGARPHRMVYIGAALSIVFILYQLFSVGYKAFAVTANENFYTTITAGSLSIVSASTSNSFTGVAVSFSSQTATASDLGAVRVADARGSGAGWSLTLQGQDWGELNNQGGANARDHQLDYDGTGTDTNLGKMCLIVASGAIRSIAGQSTTGITKGSIGCFSAGTSSLSIYTASASNGKGDYWITDFSLGQFIPSNPTAQNLTTTLTLTLS